MMPQAEFESTVSRLKSNASVEQDAKEVQAKFGSMFTTAGIAALDPQMFRAFLRYEENKHWTGIHRWGGKLTADLPRLKGALSILVDESRPIAARIDEARGMIDGLGKAVISAILQVAYPDKYGIYNNPSEEGLRELGLFPGDSVDGFDSLSTGRRYERVNRVLTELSSKYGISLWALDTALGALGFHEGTGSGEATAEVPVAVQNLSGEGLAASRFALERHLEDFLVENWGETPLAHSLEILADEDGELTGEQFPTGVGPIDILCKSKDQTGYTVVELKKGQTSDDTVGQVTRYMGWVKKNLAKDGQSVKGLIVCREADEKLMTALSMVPNVEVFTYAVSFTLSKKG